ncbi:hypothetical protein MKW94_001267 [Papaver nudicaule]|uniref:Cyclin-like domain-containing protein n=1 Tax=Papaver nudicaule TaxID=74823 RepID=A0AA41V5P7_PAPNU|nr:hypothetical protein [Papaver nudicaule]
MKCPYCSGLQGKCTTTTSGRSVTECCACGRIVEERQHQVHDLFYLRAQDSPLCVVTSDLSSIIPSPEVVGHNPNPKINKEVEEGGEEEEEEDEEDPFEPTGFITAFSTWSLEPNPITARSCISFSGYLAELERSIDSSSSSGTAVVVDNLRAYLHIIDVSSILDLDFDISDHAFQLFRDCSLATCLRNRSVEALATAALVQAIREAQEPRTLQEISNAAKVPQKEIGKYIKILGEALQLSQPINSNSISVHMPRFCTLLQLNKSAQELATHIGEVVINKCFCTRRNPISISAAAIYLACQLEDKRKTQAEICKVTGLTEVTLRKVYKELLENWDDLLPPNYTPAIPPEKAFPTTLITARSSSAPRIDPAEVTSFSDRDKQPEVNKPRKSSEPLESDHQPSGKEESEIKAIAHEPHGVANNPVVDRQRTFWQGQVPFGGSNTNKTEAERSRILDRGIDMNEVQLSPPEIEHKVVKREPDATTSSQMLHRFGPSASSGSSTWHFQTPLSSQPHVQYSQSPPQIGLGFTEIRGAGNQNRNDNRNGDTEKQ